ncbi:MAG: hypothetical protein WC791_01725 [Candidatus Paceibacterota bacterium]|jgi:hypothetical protein
MILQYKKTLSILFAVLVGIGIVFFAWKSTSVTYVDKLGTAADRGWKDSLSVVPQTSSSTTFGSSKKSNDPASAEATSTTALMAQKLLSSYAAFQTGMSTTTMSDEDVSLLAQNLLDTTPAAITTKVYSEKDLVVIETSTSAVTQYKKSMLEAINTLFSEDIFEELTVVNKAISAGDATLLNPLSKSISVYQKFINTLLSIKVPRSEISLHLYMIESYATILSGVIDLKSIINDPVVGMRGIAKYNSGLSMVSQTGSLFSQKK